MKDYVQPSNAGLQSEPRAVGRRIGKLLDALSLHVNRYIVQGEIEQDCWRFRTELMRKLEDSGWRVNLNAREKFTVLPPKGKEF